MQETIIINGEKHDVSQVPLHETILDYLRKKSLTGTKCGCNEGDCGACTLLLLEKDKEKPRAINGCLALVKSLAGRELITVEGLEGACDGKLHSCQEQMVEQLGSQCGYCTPGFICSMAEASARGITESGDEEAILDQLCGNLCRCTGYRPIREAALATKQVDLPQRAELEKPASTENFYRPETVAEALELKKTHPEAVFLAGATEIAVLMNKRGTRPKSFIFLDTIEQLKSISNTEAHWRVGAGAVLNDVETLLAEEYPAMKQMFRLFASRQIRHRATLGGNLATASPIADSPPVLLALDAVIILDDGKKERRVPISDFFTGYRQTVMREDELITAVEIPRNLTGKTRFLKVSKRREMDISTVSAAIRIATNSAGKVTEARLAFGGIAEKPSRACNTENALIGKSWQELGGEDILSTLSKEFSPIDDHRGSANYRQTLISSLFLKYLNEEEEEPQKLVQTSFAAKNKKSQPVENAIEHVTGRTKYVEDRALGKKGLCVWPVRSTHASAKILSIDIDAAESMEGVSLILTAKDVTGLNNVGVARHDEPLFAEGEVHHHGQLIAAVVGDSLETCRHAAEKVEVSYEAKEPILGIHEAISKESYHTEPHVLERGNTEEGFAASAHIIEGTLEIGGQEHFYLETHAASAAPDGDGGLLIQSSTQHPSEIQTMVSEVLGLTRHKVVVEAVRMGGGFGGKETQGNTWASVCALAAMRTQQEVFVQLDRDIDMEWSGKRHPFFAKYRVGVDKNGKLLAADVKLVSDGGWALDLSQPVCDRALFHLDNAYYIPNVHFQGQVAKTNVTSHTAFRGFGGPQGMIVIEEIMGRVAQNLNLPPELVRSTNFYHGSGETSTTHYGELVEDSRIQRIWDELLESSDYKKRKEELASWNQANKYRKRGLAITPVKFGISFTLKHYNQAGALVLIYADGSVQVNHGGTEMGQGLHSKILRVAEDELGIPAQLIRIMGTRTDKVPNTSATAASAGSDLNGMAVADACGKLRARLVEVATKAMGGTQEEVRFEKGVVRCGQKEMSFQELVAQAYISRVSLSATGFYKTPDLAWDWDVRKGRPFHYFSFGAAVSEVEIDGFTGMHRVRRTDILHDVGDSLNPSVDRGQIEGAYIQGLGWLTSEELKWSKEGRLLTHSASTYAIPAISDAPPEFRVQLLDKAKQARTIHGSKAVGEPPFMLAFSAREALRDALNAFGKQPSPEEFPSPLSSEVVKNIIGDC